MIATTAAARRQPIVSEASQWIDHNTTTTTSTISKHSNDHHVGDDDRRNRPKVLLVDDNPDMRSYLARLLGNSFHVISAHEGQHALELMAAQGPPDVVLTDWMMPNMDGEALTRAMKSDIKLQHVPIIMLSARTGASSSITGLQLGVDDYLSKPFSANELLTRLQIQLRHTNLRQNLERSVNSHRHALNQSETNYRMMEIATAGAVRVRQMRDSNVEPLETSLPSIDFSDLAFGGVLGEGSFGVVYQGTHRNENVAIKKFLSATRLQEIEMLSSIRHRHIVQ
jgi:DNA-binding response OmpR family regulator